MEEKDYQTTESTESETTTEVVIEPPMPKKRLSKKTILIIVIAALVIVAISTVLVIWLMNRTDVDCKESKKHIELESKIGAATYETAYSDLFTIFQSAIAHKKECGCDLYMDDFMEKMLCGEWKDSDNKYMTHTYKYEDYNNRYGNTWYNTNLLTSKISNNTYYYYIKNTYEISKVF